MKKLLSRIVNFNRNVNFTAKEDDFPILGILFLTIASWVTTFMGMWEYTDLGIIAFLGSSGLQLLMLYSAVRFAHLARKQDMKGVLLLVLFFSAMSVSSFFSFAAFHQVIEPPERRAAEADTLIRSEWSRLFNKIKIQVVGEFNRRLNDGSRGNGRSYEEWARSVETLRTESDKFKTTSLALVTDRLNTINNNPTVALTNSRKEQVATLLNRRSELERAIATQERKNATDRANLEALQKKAQNELEKGGEPLENGKFSKPGKGKLYEARLYDAQMAERRYSEQEASTAALRAEFDAVNQQIERLNKEQRAVGGQEDYGRQLSLLTTARTQLDDFRNRVAALKTPPGSLAGSTADSLTEAATAISNATAQCRELKADYVAVKSALRAADLMIGDEPGISGAMCDQEPRFADGMTIPQHIASFTSFLGNCGPIKSTQPVSVEKPAAGAFPRSLDGRYESVGDRAYATQFQALQDRIQGCLNDAPNISSSAATQDIVDDFRAMMQKYNPQAHPFTRAIAAFERRDPSALFAAFIAMVIDGLIFMAGLAMQKQQGPGNPVSLVETDNETASEIAEFARDRKDVLKAIGAAIESEIPSVFDVNGYASQGYIINRHLGLFQTLTADLERMHNLGLIRLDDDNLYVDMRNALAIKSAYGGR